MKWAVELIGRSFDLQDWAEALRHPFDPWVEVISRSEGDAYALHSSEFESAGSAEEVQNVAAALVSRLSGAMALTKGCDKVRLGKVFGIHDDGTIEEFAFAALTGQEMRDRVGAVGVSIGPDGKLVPPAPPSRSPPQVWIEATASSTLGTIKAGLVGDLLAHADRCDNWYDIYKTIEFAEKLVGGEHKLVDLMGPEGPVLKNARTTANHYRHARAHLPDSPTAMPVARSLAFSAARRALSTCG